MARRVLKPTSPTMTPIDDTILATVRGGFLGALLAAAPGILQGVTGIIGAAKGGGGAAPPGGAPQQQGGSPAGAAAAPAGANPMAGAQRKGSGGGGGRGGDDGGIGVDVSITYGPQQR
jgi:hypothetical protein